MPLPVRPHRSDNSVRNNRRVARVVTAHALNEQRVITFESFNRHHAAMVERAQGDMYACSASDHLGNHTQLLKHGQVIRKAWLLDYLIIAQTENRHVREGYRFASKLHPIYRAGMRGFDQ